MSHVQRKLDVTGGVGVGLDVLRRSTQVARARVERRKYA